MALDICRHGLAQRYDDGRVTIYRPGKNSAPGVEIEVSEELADTYRLASGDVVEGTVEPIEEFQSAMTAGPEWWEDQFREEEQIDEPAVLRGGSIPTALMRVIVPSERLVSVTRINGLTLEEAEERPSPRRKRSPSERAAPDRLLQLATGPKDTTGRLLDFAAPLGAGDAGLIAGPHAGGLTRTLRAVVGGVCANAPDSVVLVLLLRARGEEITDWRRRFPQTDVIVCPAPQGGASPEQTLRVAHLTLECAQRQTELGRPVLLAVDSLTGLWGTMLEAEGADAQAAADVSQARQNIREWVQRAGNFSGQGPLGGSLGGSLTLIGTAWSHAIDPEAEEEREVHPHLRLLEHILYETSWRVPVSQTLAHQRLYPAVDTAHCLSQNEEKLLPPVFYDRLTAARSRLADLSLIDRYETLLDALERTPDNNALLDALLLPS